MWDDGRRVDRSSGGVSSTLTISKGSRMNRDRFARITPTCETVPSGKKTGGHCRVPSASLVLADIIPVSSAE